MPATFRASFAVVFFLAAAVSLAQAPDPGPYRVGGEVLRPEKISGDPPEYTEMARKARVMGVVIIEVVIDEQGNVTETKVLKGLPMGLDQTAVEAVKTWKFKPATRDGRPVPVYYILTVNFQLDSGLSFGPLFGQFLRDNSEFAGLVRDKSYSEALRWLDGRPRTAEIHLARTYVLLALGQVEEAWDAAQAYDGPEPYEILHHVGLAARDRASAEPDEEVRAGIVEVGLQAATRALAVRKDDAGAMEVKSELLRQKAKLTLDPDEENALLEEAYALWKRATELRPPGGPFPEKMAGGGPPYRVGGNVTRPEKIAGAPPQYTLEARKARVTGVVILEAVIDEQGNVTDVRVLKGLPDRLDEAAVEAVRTWKFSPARMDGKPVPVWYTLTVKFTIEEEKEPDVPRASP